MNMLKHLTELIKPSTVKCSESPLDTEMPFDPMYSCIYPGLSKTNSKSSPTPRTLECPASSSSSIPSSWSLPTHNSSKASSSTWASPFPNTSASRIPSPFPTPVHRKSQT